MFLKAPSAIIAHGEAVRLPANRTQIDWECELGLVVGKTATNVAPSEAADYIFGYTLELDVSDRDGRGDTRYGSDWLIGKSRDTFAPMGPFITPREFVNDPTNMGITFVLNGNVMQESNTNLMIHNVFEQVAYASNILTLLPGDVIATGHAVWSGVCPYSAPFISQQATVPRVPMRESVHLKTPLSHHEQIEVGIPSKVVPLPTLLKSGGARVQNEVQDNGSCVARWLRTHSKEPA